jgi:hypothetical protein
VSLLHAHLVFVTKYGAVFTGAMLTFAETTMRSVCAELDVELVEFNGKADHVICSWLIRQPWRSPHWRSGSRAAPLIPHGVNIPASVSAPACADTCGRHPISPSRAAAHRCR